MKDAPRFTTDPQARYEMAEPMESRQLAKRRHDQLERGEIQAYLVERTASGTVFVKAVPRMIIDRAA